MTTTYQQLVDAALSQSAASSQIQRDIETLQRLKLKADEREAFQNMDASFTRLQQCLDEVLPVLERKESEAL